MLDLDQRARENIRNVLAGSSYYERVEIGLQEQS
jgi:hypothetical protein